MNKLLSANLARLWKSKVFRLCALSIFLLGAYGYWEAYDYVKKGILQYTLERQMFSPVPLVGIVIAILCSLFFGAEFGFGTIRNKLTAGYTKTVVYLAMLLTGVIAGLILCVFYLMATILVGMPLLGFFETDLVTVAYFAFCMLGVVCVFTAIMMLIVIVCANRATAVVLGSLLALILIFVSGRIDSRLYEPEMMDQYILIDSTGRPIEVEAQPNPLYLEGTAREVCQWIHDILPSGQSMQISNLAGDYPLRWPACSLIVFFAVSGLGICLFERKDLS